MGECNPVSYTHLDVYKRQLFGNGRGSDTGKALIKDILTLGKADLPEGLKNTLTITFSEEKTREFSSYGHGVLTIRGWGEVKNNKLESAVTFIHELTHVYTAVYGYETCLLYTSVPA